MYVFYVGLVNKSIRVFCCHLFHSMGDAQQRFDWFLEDFRQQYPDIEVDSLFYSVFSIEQLRYWSLISRTIGTKAKTKEEKEYVRNKRWLYIDAFLNSGVAA